MKKAILNDTLITITQYHYDNDDMLIFVGNKGISEEDEVYEMASIQSRFFNLKNRQLADLLQVTERTITEKLKNPELFRAVEVIAICDLLDISLTEFNYEIYRLRKVKGYVK